MVNSPYPIIVRIGHHEVLLDKLGKLFSPSTWPTRGSETLAAGDKLFWLGPYHFAVSRIR
jgi:hypothetical protein